MAFWRRTNKDRYITLSPPATYYSPSRLRSYTLAAISIGSLVISLALNVGHAHNLDAPTVVAGTAYFNPNRTYLLNSASGSEQIKCKVREVDGAWLKCEGENLTG